MLERCTTLKGYVFEYSECSDTELAAWLLHARALLFPSFTEGYGMPLVEALSLGVPVLASDLPVFREIASDIPEYIEPLDGKRWEESIMAYTSSASEARTEQCSRISQYRAPLWEHHFKQVEQLMEEVRNKFR
jgi:glycosyltransferase involved in cell wall biosynthesis